MFSRNNNYCIMNKWDELSMAERANYIRLGVQNGIVSLDGIKEVYNKYADGGKVKTRAGVHNIGNYVILEGEDFYRRVNSDGTLTKTPYREVYNNVIKPLKERGGMSLAEYYTGKYRDTQARRRKSAREKQDIKGNERIKITKGKSAGVEVPVSLIDSMVMHYPLDNIDTLYIGVAGVPSQETDFGKNRNFTQDRGEALSILNNERFELPAQSYYNGISYAIRQYYRKNKTQREGLSEENYVKKYLNLDNMRANKKLSNDVRTALENDLTPKRFEQFTKQDLHIPNLYEDTWEHIIKGDYNRGDPNYMSKVGKQAKQLMSDPNLTNYMRNKKYIK